MLSGNVETGVEVQKCKCEQLQIKNTEFIRKIEALETKYSEVNDCDLEKAVADLEDQLVDNEKN